MITNFLLDYHLVKTLYVLFVRSILEKYAVVWHSSLSEENKRDLERVQKSATKLILGDKYLNYENALKTLNIDTLDQRREKLCLNFAIKCTKNQRTKDMFPLKTKVHNMKSRNTEKYQVQYALQKSPIIHMQHLLNQNNH